MRKIIFFVLALAVGAGSCKSANASGKEKPEKPPLNHVKNAEQVIVFYQKGKFGGWPANNGAFVFDGDEMLAGFTVGDYKLTKNGHNIVEPYYSWLARSTDGGETWKAWDPDNYVGDFGNEPELKRLESPVNFTKPGFVMRVVGTAYHGADDPRGHFFYSYDAGNSWKGPYGFGDLLNHPELRKYGLGELTPRTDYVVLSDKECLVFISARVKGEFGSDRLFCVKTSDGGKTFNFHGWVVRPFRADETEGVRKVPLFENKDKNPYATQCRAVMSQTFLLDDGKLLTVMRRKYRSDDGQTRNWVDAYVSQDGGKTWVFQSKVGDAGAGNGNPPALALTADGRLCAVFGERQFGTIQVAYSTDEGKSWSEPLILFDGFWSEDMEYNDLGYPRVLRRGDGKLVAIFYYSTKDHPHHIHATIWDPAQ